MSDPKESGSSNKPLLSEVTGPSVPLSIRWPSRYQPEDFEGTKAFVVMPRTETNATRAMRAFIQTAKERLGFEESDLPSAVRILPLFIRYVTGWKFSLQKTDEAWHVSFLYYFNRTSSSLVRNQSWRYCQNTNKPYTLYQLARLNIICDTSREQWTQ